MPYFVKLTTDGSSWGWCYVRHVQRSSSVVTLVGSMVPLPGGSALPLFGGDYPWDVAGGWMHAYHVTCDLPWLDPTAAELRYPSWVPPNVIEKGFEDVVAFVLRGSPLRKVFADEAIRRSVAEDLALERATSFLRSPSFVPVDETEFDRWRTARPEAYRFAAEDADRIVANSKLAPHLIALRRMLRIETHRKLDRAREDFVQTPCIASEPFLELPTSAGPMKVGRSKSTTYPEGVGAPPVSPRMRDPEAVETTEAAILPGAGNLSERLEYLPWQQKIAAWEEFSPYPAFACSQWTEYPEDPDFVPPGLQKREGIAGARSELSPFGIYPLISQPALDFASQTKLAIPTAEECAMICLRRAWRV